jgi:hypothetical protein
MSFKYSLGFTLILYFKNKIPNAGIAAVNDAFPVL